jgi:hypothetical protein
LSFDSDCDCHWYDADTTPDFDCTMSAEAFAKHVSVPASCDFDESYVERTGCDDGSQQFEWLVGEENGYQMVLDGNVPIYGSAEGYVGEICGIDPALGSFGTVTAGTLPARECGDSCLICGVKNSNSTPPACGQCTPIDANGMSATEPLDAYCAQNDCPTLDEARAHALVNCPTNSDTTNYARMYEDCGIVAVEFGSPFFVNRSYYDAQTKALVGIYTGNDTPFGPCNVFTYLVGQIPSGDCASATRCDLCAAAVGAGGASGGLEACAP